MPSAIVQALRSRGFALCLHAGLWLLLYLAVTGLGGKAPEYRESSSYYLPLQSPVPVGRLDSLFASTEWPKPLSDTNSPNPFITRYFVPPPTPTPPPPPPPPTTRKIEVTYQGFYQTADGPRHALVKVADALLIARIGAPVVTNLFVAEATMQTLTLTNPAAQTNLLLLNTKKELEVPIR